MVDFRTDAAFSHISGTYVPTFEYVKNYTAKRKHNGQLLYVENKEYTASMKHHRIINDPSIYPTDVLTFPKLDTVAYLSNNTVYTSYHDEHGQVTYYEYFNYSNMLNSLDDPVEVLIGSIGSNPFPNSYCYKDGQYFGITIDSKLEEEATAYDDLFGTNITIPLLILKDGLYIGQQLVIESKGYLYVVDIRFRDISLLYDSFSRGYSFSNGLLMLVWSGTEWKQLNVV